MANFCSDKKLAFDHINELGTSVDRLPGPKVFAGPKETRFLTCKLAIFKGNPMETDHANLQVRLAGFSFSLAAYCSSSPQSAHLFGNTNTVATHLLVL